MLDPVHIFGNHLKRIRPAVCKVSGIKQQAYILWICIRHHALYLVRVLYNRSHMMMESKCDSVFIFGDLAKTVHTLAECLPLIIIHHILVSEDRCVLLPLYAVALFGSADHLSSHRFQESKLCTEFLLHLFKRLRDQERREPLVADLDSS